MTAQRNIPARGFRPVYYLIGVGAIMTYGFYKYGVGVREHKYVLPIIAQIVAKGRSPPYLTLGLGKTSLMR